jgi:hypothetical protein
MLGFHKSAAMKAAVELDLFTAIGEGHDTPATLAKATGAAERGVRILADFLTVNGFLTKTDGRYAQTPSTAAFLDRRSPAWIGSVVDFLISPEHVALYLGDPTAYVGNGGSVGLAAIAPDHPVWIKFAEAMKPFVGASAEAVAAEVAGWPRPPRKVLDIAAGHGLFGIGVARAVPGAEIVAVDWQAVVALAERNAKAAGVGDRFRGIAGSAFDVDWGGGYDLILLPNFLHHFDHEACVALLRKARASLAPEGRVLAVEFVPNEDRVSPPFPATFAFVMLGSTPAGDAYTGEELGRMARDAGFSGVSLKPLPPSPATMVSFDP